MARVPWCFTNQPTLQALPSSSVGSTTAQSKVQSLLLSSMVAEPAKCSVGPSGALGDPGGQSKEATVVERLVV